MDLREQRAFARLSELYPGWKTVKAGAYIGESGGHWGQVIAEADRYQGGASLELHSGASSPYLHEVLFAGDRLKRPGAGSATYQGSTSSHILLIIHERHAGEPTVTFDPRDRYKPAPVRLAPDRLDDWLESYLSVVIPDTERLLSDTAILEWDLDAAGWLARGGVHKGQSIRLAAILARHLGRDKDFDRAMDLLRANEHEVRGYELISKQNPLAYSLDKFSKWLETLP